MAHINYHREVSVTGRQHLEDVLPADNFHASFAAFCGSGYQRQAVGIQGISRCCGRMGVVVLQNDPLLEASIRRMASGLPWLRTHAVNGGGRSYDPLYGLSATAVLDSVLPSGAGGLGVASVFSVRDYLAAYLEIMELQFHKNPAPFGRHPYNLDLLLQLVQMPFDRLNHSVLRHLPEPRRTVLLGRIQQDGAQQLTAAAVGTFAAEMSDFLWEPRGFQRHSCVSIVETVQRRGLISINVPTARPAVLDYLYEELKTLRDQRTAFLLVASGVQLTGSKKLQGLFIGQHSALNYSTGVLASDLSAILEPDASLAPLLAEHQEVLIFSCSSSSQAEPFSNALGTYQRLVRERHTERQRQPFHFFSSHGCGVGIREVTEHNINPQELVNQGGGAVLCGSLHVPPVIIRQLDL